MKAHELTLTLANQAHRKGAAWEVKSIAEVGRAHREDGTRARLPSGFNGVVQRDKGGPYIAAVRFIYACYLHSCLGFEPTKARVITNKFVTLEREQIKDELLSLVGKVSESDARLAINTANSIKRQTRFIEEPEIEN